ncbi:uncharacterized protein CANTADRAFT_90267 [Suhomyces tanzawaensis NRRL Y-17324]|uniref:Uncharacterized protein n=1 Tax=Suhomyces tanzawaensis NRRL Y-17324 TaxID=984487 RepID=A0A1E4SI39_9ASCO|nr:uncharacterized protein CANTADRAFT_90267 [Suhomyces tanzawaensis NRRL Y-17324]ODV79163.1 hypothetical protein CANTADRAFT_90267 [Suhomyces tanzawaensis NRRL Y-17324]
MSAFLMLQDTSQVKRIQRDKKRVPRAKPRSSDSTSVRSDHSSESSGKRKVLRADRLPSVASSTPSSRNPSVVNSTFKHPSFSSTRNPSIANSTTAYRNNSIANSTLEDYVPLHERKKKVFDLDTCSYVYKTIELPPLEMKISEFEQKFMALTNECKYHHLNESLNKYKKDSGELLFSVRNAHILRYSYFEEFINDYQLIQLKANQFKRNGDHKLKYMRKIAKITMRSDEVNGFPSMLAPISADNVDELKTDEESEDDEQDEEMDMMYRLNKFSLTEQKPEKKASDKPAINVRMLFKSNQFWNNVYQDLKYDSIQVKSTFNYFELLPPIHQTMNFFGELIDYLLYNLFILSGDPTNLESLADVQTIQNYNFFYYKDFSYEYVHLMRGEHFKMYNNQSLINGSINHMKSTDSFGRKKSNFAGEVDLDTHRVLISKLIETVIENLKSATSISQSTSNMNGYDDLFGLWRSLLKFTLNELIIDGRDGGNSALQGVQERNETEREDEDETSMIFKYYEMSSSKSKSSKMNRNESISSKSTAKSLDQSIMSGSRFDSIASSVSSTNYYSQNDMQTILAASSHKTSDGFDDMKTTILPPPSTTHMHGDFPSPKSKGFAANEPSAPPTPSKKKRLIFSKFKRDKSAP